jgi:hypothetical protein
MSGDEPTISDRALGELSRSERADLLRRLQALAASELQPTHRILTVRRWSIPLLALCCLGLIPWTIGLALSLPRHYVAGNWWVAWTGFDVVLLICLAVTAWGLWKQRQIVLPAALITSVLLLCDAWFDMLTANGHRDLLVSAATALFAELPMAAFLAVLFVRCLHVSTRVTRGLGPSDPVPALWRIPIVLTSKPSQRVPL